MDKLSADSKQVYLEPKATTANKAFAYTEESHIVVHTTFRKAHLVEKQGEHKIVAVVTCLQCSVYRVSQYFLFR